MVVVARAGARITTTVVVTTAAGARRVLGSLLVGLPLLVRLDQLLDPVLGLLAAFILAGQLNRAHTVAVSRAHAQRLLRDENLRARLCGNVLDCLTLLAYDESDVAVGDIERTVRSSERTGLADKDAHFRLTWVLVDNLVDGLLGEDVLFVVSLDEHVADVGILDLALGNLDLGTALVLKPADSLAVLANDEAYGVVGHRNDVRR